MVAQNADPIITLTNAKRIPTDDRFAAEGADFLEGLDIKTIARRHIEQYPEFGHLADVLIAYAWKRTGGETNGKAVFGKCVKASGLLKYFSAQTFVIWLAADHCREWGFSNRQLEALVYHELCHCGETETKDGERKAVLLPHDVETFASEIERYGLWTDDLRRIKPTFDQAQLDLPGFGS